MNVFPRNQFFGKLTRRRTAVGCAGLWILGWLAVSWPGESQAASFQDMFTNRETVTATSGRLDGDNSAASVELNEPRHGGKAGGHSLWISWVAPADGVATFVTDNNNFDTLLSAYYFNTTNDTTLDKLHEAARDDDLVGLGQGSEIQFGARAGQRYEIAVDGFHGAIGSFRLRWDFINTTSAPPIIVSTPADAALKLGDNVTLTVNMVAGPDTQLRWFQNNNELLDEKNNVLVLTNLQPTNLGIYQLRITVGTDGGNIRYFTAPIELQINSEGATNTLARNKFLDAPDSELLGEDDSGHTLTAVTKKGTANGVGPIGVVRGYNGTQIFDTTLATTDPTEPPHCGISGGASYWLAYQPPTNGTITLDTVGSSYDTVMEVYTYNGALRSYADLISVACDNDGVAPHGPSRVTLPVVKTRQYIVVVEGVAGSRGTAWLNYRLDTNQVPTAPTLVTPPGSMIVASGTPVTLGANIKGSPPLHFSWRKNEIGIPGASASSLFLTAATAADSGIYVLTVTNDLGVLTATLPLQVVTPPRSSLVTTPTGLQLTWGTVAGQRYTLEEARTIQGPWVAWTNLYVGDGQPVTVDANAGDSGFYRIRVE